MASEKPPILIVEDEPTWAATLTAKLGKRFSVHHFTRGEDCLAKLKEIKPVLVILDYHLEGQLTGLDTLKEVRKQKPDLKVILFSAQDDVQTAMDILDNGAYEYIVKGENAMNRLNIVLRNIEEADRLKREVVELKLRFRREKLVLILVIVGIAIGSFLVYLNTCPQQRVVNWDPFGLEETRACNP